MALDRYIALGMSPADIFLESDVRRLDRRALLAAHAILDQFDDFDESPYNYGPGQSIAGFSVDVDGFTLAFHHPYGTRPKGIVEEAISAAHPEHRHLLKHASVDQGGFVTVRGMHANDIMSHPYMRACFGMTAGAEAQGDLAVLRMRTRLSALDILELPRPSREALSLMLETMVHNRPQISHSLEDHRLWLQDISRQLRLGARYTQDLAGCASLVMMSGDEKRDPRGPDHRSLSQRRLRFLSRYPGADAIFTPFPPDDDALLAIRAILHDTRDMKDVDPQIARKMGRKAWAEFVADPESFCKARLPNPIMGANDDPAIGV